MGKREAGTIFISLQLATDELRAGIRSIDGEFKKIGSTAQQLGQKLSLAFALPLAAVGRSAVKSFGDFDQAMQNSLSVMGKISDKMKTDLVKGAMQVASTTKFSADQAAEGYFGLASAGMSAAQSLKALPVVADFATVATMNLADATLVLTKTQSAFGLTVKDPVKNMENLARVANVVARASMDTEIRVSELASALGSQAAGALRQANVSIEDATAILEAFGKQNITGAKAGTALGIVVRELGIDAIKHKDAFKAAGIEVFKASGEYGNMLDILSQLDTRLKNMPAEDQLKQIMALGFNKKNAQFIQMLIGWSDQMKVWSQRNKEAAGSLNELASTMNKGFNTQMKIAMNNLQNIGIVIGAELAPYIMKAIHAVQLLVGAFMQLPDWVRHSVEVLGLLAVVIGPLTYAWGLMASGISAVLAIGGTLLGWLGALGTAIGGLIATVGAIPVLIGAAIVGGVAAIVYFWDEIKGAGQAFVDWFNSTFPGLSTLLSVVWQGMKDEAVRSWNQIAEAISTFWDWLTGLPAKAANLGIAIWGAIEKEAIRSWKQISEFIAGVFNWLAETFPNVARFAADVWNAVKQAAIDAWNAIGKFISDKINWIQDQIDTMRLGWASITGSAEEVWKEQQARKAAAAELEKQAAAQEKLNEAQSKSESMIDKLGAAWGRAKGYVGDAYNEVDFASGTLDQNTNALRTNRFALDEEEKGLSKVEKAAKKSADAISQLNKKLSEAQTSEIGKSIENQLDDAVSNLDRGAFEKLTQSLADSIKQGSEEGLQDLVKKAGEANKSVAEGLVAQIGDAKAGQAVEKWEEKWRDSATKNAKDHEKKLEEAHKNAASFWRDVFTKATSEGAFDLKNSLKELLIGFAAELAASISGGMEGGIKSVGDLGGLLAQGLASAFGFGATGGMTTAQAHAAGVQGPGMSNGMFGSAASTAGTAALLGGGAGMTTAEAHAAGIQGPGMADGSFSGSSSGGASAAGYFAAGAQVVGAGMSAGDTDKANQDNSGTGGAVGAAAGAAIGAIWGPIGSMIGAQLGQIAGTFVGGMFKWGPQNPETQARHAFANFIEEGFEKLKTVSFFDAEGKLKQFKGDQLNFLEGPSNKFNAPGWADSMNQMGDKAKGTFIGLGNAMKELLGITEDVGGQIGFLLAENLGGNIDNARLLVQQLGLSMDDMINKLVEAGVRGEMTWHEIEVSIQGVTEAFKPGLVAVGDLKGAFQELIDSGGRGMVAIKAVKDIAVEAMEAGAKTLDDLKRKLLEQGVNPADVEALMTALRQRGITTLEQLAEVSNRVGGGIVADIESSSETMRNTWAQMTAQLEDVSKKLEALPKEIQSNIHLNVTADLDENAEKVINSGAAPGVELPATTTTGAKKFAKGGIIKQPTFFNRGLGLAGEAGPEFLMPAQMMPDGSLGVRAIGGGSRDSGGVMIYVNAPNATPGMEQRIANSIREMGQRTIAQAVDIMERRSARGGRN